jgi:diguanylate cyclase (GGDEF)-like protein
MEDRLSRILVVDDNKDIHEDIKYILDSTTPSDDYLETQSLKDELFSEEADKDKFVLNIRYRIDDAYQGEEAIRMVECAQMENYPYALIFMDVRMPPGIDGIKAIEEIWKIEPNTEVVICTAYSDYSWEQILSKLGQNDHLLFIRKPFDNVSVKQIALTMTTKWKLQRQNKVYISNLESEVNKRTQELRVLVEKLTAEITLREEKEKLLAYNAHYDSLTDLLNRRSFYSVLSSVISRNNSLSEPFSLFFLDVDDFKNVNDALGHDIGDRLLVEISNRIKEVLGDHTYKTNEFIPASNLPRAIFRLGGDEFTAIVDEGDKQRLGAIADALLEKIREPYIISGHEINISCSMGISIYPEDSTTADMLLKNSDIALYEAKKTNGRYAFYEKPEGMVFLNELRLENDLCNAVKRDQIDLFYQCLVNTREEVVGVQALARWMHPELGMLNPDQFIHIAEKSDRIIKIGAHILNMAARRLKELHKAGYGGLFMLVNCTTRQFYNSDFVEIVKQALNGADLDPRFLKLGLEERFSVQTTPRSLSIINELNRIGVQFTLNGFESEYPAFVFLQKVPRDTIIKINRDFVKNIVSDTKNRNFVLSLLDIIKSWELNIIISGIETPEQKAILGQKDCILQGYHFNIPRPFNQFVEDLRKIMPPGR